VNPSWMKPDVYNPIDVDHVVAGHYPATAVRTSEKAAAVQRLTRRGWTSEDIAVQLGISERHVERLRTVTVRPPERLTFDSSLSRMCVLSARLDTALEMMSGMRDDVESVFRDLCGMPAQSVRELVMILAALVPEDGHPQELLGWVLELAKEEAA